MKINIIGCGLAGLTAAVNLASMGYNVNLISPNFSETSQSVMAMGGINAAFNTKGENDSPENHFNDTMAGGCYINNPKAVAKLTGNAKNIVKFLEGIGVSFTRDENKNIDLRYFGGQKHARTAYAGARTGKQLVTALTALCRKYEVEDNVKRYVGWRFLSLIISDGQCMGVICINENTHEIKAFTGSVILASGGMNGLFGRTSGSLLNDGYTTAKVLMQGVRLANLEMIQYHPTTVGTPSKRMLVTEAARGEGGKLFVLKDGQPWYFMKQWYPEMAELMPRDVVSRSIYKASDAGKKQVYLDISHLSDETVKVKLDEVYSTCMKHLNLDPTSEPIPVYPGIHYFMGGIKTDENHKTNIKGLYAAGECSCQYHGANRLGGNSLLGAVHGGYIASKNIVEENIDIDDEAVQKAIDNEKRLFNSFDASSNGVLISDIENDLSDIMNSSMGIYRSEEGLKDAINQLDRLSNLEFSSKNYYDYVRVKALFCLAKACLLSALGRKESRGAHQRIDYPKTSEFYEKTTCVDYDGGIKISFEGFDE